MLVLILLTLILPNSSKRVCLDFIAADNAEPTYSFAINPERVVFNQENKEDKRVRENFDDEIRSAFCGYKHCELQAII